MEMVNAGWLSILPPIIAIGLALITKEVLSSLMLGIVSGAVIYVCVGGFGPLTIFDAVFGTMVEKMGENASVLLFLALLGALVAVVTMAGGSKAYGDWAASKIKNKAGAQLATSILGIFIFIDDYFNCLTVGTVMRPVTDKYKVSRAKLAYIIDSTAAPVCIIAPISSWAATIASTMQSSGIQDGMGTLVATIPYNLYALLTIAMVVLVSLKKLDFGPMARFERQAELGLESREVDPADAKDDFDGMEISEKGTVLDLLIPIGGLIVATILAMLYTGGLFTGGASNIVEAFGNTDAFMSLVYGGFVAIIIAFLTFVPRKVLGFRQFMGGLTVGFKSMIAADTILVLAWTISGMCRELLNTEGFVAGVVQNNQFALTFLPAIIFLIAAGMSFALGTSWGTFMMLIPIVIAIFGGETGGLMIPTLAATLAGSVFGDHCSPISDSTIMSSTGAGVRHIDHVSTQIPYALLVAGCSFVGYLMCVFTTNVFVILGVALALFLVCIFLLHNVSAKHMAEAQQEIK